MAKIDIKLPDSFLNKLDKLEKNTDKIIEVVLQEGAEVVATKVDSNLNAVIGIGVKNKTRKSCTDFRL